jgi:type IV pilus assembly protein PilC
MPKYSFVAQNKAGKIIRGELEAVNEEALANNLNAQNLTLVSTTEQKKNFLNNLLNLNFGKVPLKEKMFFVRNLAVMINAGLALSRALDALVQQTSSKKLSRIIQEVVASIRKGNTFADSLSNYPKEFSNLFVNMIRVGETAGNLEEVLKTLYLQMKKEHALRSKVKGALVYPAVIVVAMVAVGTLLMIYVVPSLAATFQDLNAELPATTKVVIWLSENLVSNWYFFLIGLVVLVIGLRFAFKTKSGKEFASLIGLNIPLIGPLIKKVNSARFSRTLSSLVKAGIPIVRALEITSNTLTNRKYAKAASRASEVVQKGGQLSSVVAEYPKLFPPMIVQMISIGEETGTIASLLARVAVFFENEVSQTTKNMSAIIEPILMVVIGLVVGFFAISMIQPMYSLVGSF